MGYDGVKDLNGTYFHINVVSFFSHSYEIQLESGARGKGLGKFLMQILEMMAHRCVLNKTFLLVDFIFPIQIM